MEYYGFKPEPKAIDRTWNFTAVRKKVAASISYNGGVDLRPFTSKRHNQSHSGSCAAQGIVKGAEIKRIQKHGRNAHVDLSRLAVYFLARELENPPMTNVDEGSYISFCADVLRRFGACPENYWPFDLNKLFVPPSWKAMRKAYLGKIQEFWKIKSTGSDRVDDVILTLQSGNPVVYGTKIDNSWKYYHRSSKPLDVAKGTLLGGHCTVIVGWNPKREVFYGENSWGEGWGIKPDYEYGDWDQAPLETTEGGYYEMKPDVVASDQASDFIVMAGGWEPWSKSQ